MSRPTGERTIIKRDGEHHAEVRDVLVVEEPCEIRIDDAAIAYYDVFFNDLRPRKNI